MMPQLDLDAILRIQLRMYLLRAELERMLDDLTADVPEDLGRLVPADYKPTEH